MRVGPGALAVLAAACVLPLPATAFEPSLSVADTQAALIEGDALARAHQGYPIARYLLYAVPNALAIDPTWGSIDAVVVATPYERVRFAAYVARFQMTQIRPSDVDAARAPDSVDFLIFAHSDTRKDQFFLKRFAAPVARIRGYGTLASTSVTRFGPTLDFFNAANGDREMRWLGYATYRFDLKALAARGLDERTAKGEFSIVDPYGERYAFYFQLGRYR